MKSKIKFSHLYKKMPDVFFTTTAPFTCKTYLVGVSLVDIENLPKVFLEWDTKYFLDKFDAWFHYPLPAKGKYLVLMLFTNDGIVMDCWTTIRRWTEQKEKYYRGLIGKEVEIEMTS